MIIIFLFLAELLVLFFLSQTLTRLLSQVFFIITKSQTKTIQLLAFMFFPGVVVHELAHFFVASLLFVKTGEIEFLPKVQGESVKLGSVAIAKTDPFRRFLIGVAPVLIGITIIFSVLFYFFTVFETLDDYAIWQYFFVGYIVFQVGNTMFSSKKDMEGALVLLVMLFLFVAAFYISGIRFPKEFVSIFDLPAIQKVIKQASLFLLVPIVIDVIVCSITHFFIRQATKKAFRG